MRKKDPKDNDTRFFDINLRLDNNGSKKQIQPKNKRKNHKEN